METVAVYGTLKRAFNNHRVMVRAGGEYIGTTRTVQNFNLHDGGFPVVVPGDTSPVTVEAYLVADLGPLDALEGHPSFYKRELVELEEIGPAWMYIYQHKPGDRALIPSGVWRE